jgi:hypothetical protein
MMASSKNESTVVFVFVVPPQKSKKMMGLTVKLYVANAG